MESRDELASLLADCHERLERGEAVDREGLLASHPELADQLSSCFDLSDLLDQAVAEDAAGLLAEMPETIDEFRLVREIGRGGMGVVYEAVQVPLDRRVALKVLSCSLERRAVRRFQQEVRAAGSLSHSNIVPIHAMGRHRGLWYYAMELVEGQPLDRVIDERREAGRPERSSWIELARAFAGAADALETAHRAGIIHRDIKPGNLLLDVDGRLRIVDFGLAHLGEGGVVTVTGALVGTPAYMSPEQAMAKGTTLDHRTDVYSLGATLYEVLTLRPPYRGDSLHEICAKIVTRDVEPPRKVDLAIPKDLETIVLKAMEKDRSRRYATAREMAQDLRRFAEGDSVHARRPNPIVRSWNRLRRHRMPSALAGLGLALAAAAIVLALALGEGVPEVTPRDAADRELDRGAALLAQRRLPDALAAIERAIELDPGSARAHLERARVMWARRRWAETAESCDASLAIEESVDAHHLRGLTLARLGRQADAIASYRRVRELAPDSPRSLQSLALTLWSVSRFEEALPAFREALDRGAHVAQMARFEVACLRALGRADLAEARAIEHVESGVAARSSDHLAFLQAAAGRTDEARRTLEGSRADPFHRAILSAMLGDADGVRRWLEAAVESGDRLLEGVDLDWELRRYLVDPEIRALAERLRE